MTGSLVLGTGAVVLTGLATPSQSQPRDLRGRALQVLAAKTGRSATSFKISDGVEVRPKLTGGGFTRFKASGEDGSRHDLALDSEGNEVDASGLLGKEESE